MAKWYFEPGHTEVEFRARHMMVTWVRGLFKNITGTLWFDPEHPEQMRFETSIAANTLWTGVEQRDDHLRPAPQTSSNVEHFLGDHLQEHLGARHEARSNTSSRAI